MNTNAGSSPSPNTEISTPSMGTVSMAGQIQLLRRELAQAQADLAVRTEELLIVARALLNKALVAVDYEVVTAYVASSGDTRVGAQVMSAPGKYYLVPVEDPK
jgi:hypothetical protein